MNGKEIIGHLYSFKVKPTNEYPSIKLKGAKNLQVFLCDTRSFVQKILRKPIPRIYAAWFEPKRLVPFLYGYIAFNYEGTGWTEPEPITRSMVIQW